MLSVQHALQTVSAQELIPAVTAEKVTMWKLSALPQMTAIFLLPADTARSTVILLIIKLAIVQEKFTTATTVGVTVTASTDARNLPTAV